MNYQQAMKSHAFKMKFGFCSHVNYNPKWIHQINPGPARHRGAAARSRQRFSDWPKHSAQSFTSD
jgi:hypothetical protein